MFKKAAMDALRERLLGGASSTAGADISGHSINRQGTGLSSSSAAEEERYLLRRRRDPRWRLDRGAGYYEQERDKYKKPHLIQTGRRAGRSRVKLTGIDLQTFYHHMLKRDFFNTVVGARIRTLLIAFFVVYLATIFIWAFCYWVMWKLRPPCFVGLEGFDSAFMFTVETQFTIGYGVRAPMDCWEGALLVAVHSISTVLMNSILLGIVFARIAHPRKRGRTIMISDCAVIARRDGVLKFMFRVADIHPQTAIHPRIRVYLYTWGDGRRTAEGEYIPAWVQEMHVDHMDPALLLPMVVEHTIDERSPLYGHTQHTLEAVDAEIVVVFEGTAHLGDSFMVRQSYLASEIHWGHVFVPIAKHAELGETEHMVDIARFHDVEPQADFAVLRPSKLSQKVVNGGANTVPGQVLKENTLALSDDCCLAPRDGVMHLMCRVGDTLPGQMLQAHVRMYLYRWGSGSTAEGEQLGCTCEHLAISNPQPLLLRFPVVVTHAITDASPVAAWRTLQGMRRDAEAEIVVQVTAVMYATSQTMTKSKVYKVLGDVKWGYAFRPVVANARAAGSARYDGQVDWSSFHATSPLSLQGGPTLAAPQLSPLTSPPAISPRASGSTTGAGLMLDVLTILPARDGGTTIGTDDGQSSEHTGPSAGTRGTHRSSRRGQEDGWAANRSLFTALEGIQQYQEEQRQGEVQQPRPGARDGGDENV